MAVGDGGVEDAHHLRVDDAQLFDNVPHLSEMSSIALRRKAHAAHVARL